MSKEKTSVTIVFSMLVIGIVIGAISGVLSFATMVPVKYVEIEPKAPESALEFYVAYLNDNNYTVTEKALSVNEYERLESFNEFLWILETANATQCFVDYGYGRLFGYRVPKLWIQYDGIYWELRL